MKFIERLFSNLNKGPRIIVAFILFSWISSCNRFYPPMDIILGGFFSLLAIAWLSCSFIYKTPKQQQTEKEKQLHAMEQELRFQEIENRKSQLAEEERLRKDRQAQWERSHGRIVTRLAGVTFDNPDGSSRQAYLKAAYEDDCAGDIQLDTYSYNGEDAIRLLYEGRELGNIPRDVVPDILAVLDRIVDADLDISIFEPDELDEDMPKPKKIYRADLTLTYSKNEM